jgi:hypothetical protein
MPNAKRQTLKNGCSRTARPVQLSRAPGSQTLGRYGSGKDHRPDLRPPRRRFVDRAHVCVVADRGLDQSKTLAELGARRLLFILGCASAPTS